MSLTIISWEDEVRFDRKETEKNQSLHNYIELVLR